MTTKAEQESQNTGSSVVDSVDQIIRWPLKVAEATMDLALEGAHRITGQSNGATSSESQGEIISASSSRSSDGAASIGSSIISALAGDQDLSGNDLKYVLWSIVFTKPGCETVLEPQQDDLVNYSTDASNYAAMKIAKFLDNAGHGRVEKPEAWGKDRGFRILPEDQKYITCLFHVERRLPKQEAEVTTRIERVTVERGHSSPMA